MRLLCACAFNEVRVFVAWFRELAQVKGGGGGFGERGSSGAGRGEDRRAAHIDI